jgi:uncharacterized protein
VPAAPPRGPSLDTRGPPPIVTALGAAQKGARDLEMRFRINEIGDDGLALDLPLSAEWLKTECPDLDATLAKGGLTFRGRLSRDGEGDDAFLRGNIRGALTCACARCLEPARLPLDLPVNIAFVARAQEKDQDDEDEDEDVDVAPFDGDEIDVGPQIREQILLAVPINPLCRETCAGLCPFCGGNRNLVPCDCASRQETPRTPLGAALGKLKM